MTTADRQCCQTRDNQTQKTRSTCVRWIRRRRDRWRTWTWCRSARISSWSVTREPSDSRAVRRSAMKTDSIGGKPIRARQQHQSLQRVRTFQQAQATLGWTGCPYSIHLVASYIAHELWLPETPSASKEASMACPGGRQHTTPEPRTRGTPSVRTTGARCGCTATRLRRVRATVGGAESDGQAARRS